MKIPLEIISSVIKEPYCKIDGIKDKIRSLTKDVMDMIYVVAAGNSSSSYDLQVDSEEELKQIREKTVEYVSEKVKEYIINDLLSGVSEEQGSFTIVSPSRICKYLCLITDKYLAILIGDFSKTL